MLNNTANPELKMVMLCYEMKWDYYTYDSQPKHFTDSLFAYMNTMNMVQKEQSEQARAAIIAANKARGR